MLFNVILIIESDMYLWCYLMIKKAQNVVSDVSRRTKFFNKYNQTPELLETMMGHAVQITTFHHKASINNTLRQLERTELV